MILLGHLSDPHLGPLPSARIRDLAGKRAIGFVNWHRRRKTIHRGEVLSRIVSDLKAQNPDHIAVTGDILNIALPGEFAPSRVWLDTVGPAHDVTFVPGNHDAYVRKAARQWHSHWGDFMRGDTTAPDQFPFVRRRGDIALIGLSSAITTAPFMATGKIGTPQLHALPDILDHLHEEGLFRVVLIHHPPITKPSHRFKRLLDADKFRDGAGATRRRAGAARPRSHSFGGVAGWAVRQDPGGWCAFSLGRRRRRRSRGLQSLRDRQVRKRMAMRGGDARLSPRRRCDRGDSAARTRGHLALRPSPHPGCAKCRPDCRNERRNRYPPKITAVNNRATRPITNPSKNIPSARQGFLTSASATCVPLTRARSRSTRRAAT